MEFLKTDIEDRIIHVYLNRGKSNAMHLEVIQELQTTLAQAQQDPAIEGLVIHGQEGFFSSGLDLITLYQYDEQEIRQLWNAFMQLVQTFVAFDKPAVAAISGHSPAGGCVLALCCDYRVMAAGEYIIGLNEIPVGIIVPESIFHLYSFWLGQAKAYQYLLEGKLLSPEQARDAGLVDEVVPQRSIRTAASRQVKTYTQYERNAWRHSKRNLRRTLVEQFTTDQQQTIDAILKQWWSPSTRSILKTIIDNLQNKK